jgi:hypothetical protein
VTRRQKAYAVARVSRAEATGTSSGSVGEMLKVQASRRLRGRWRNMVARVCCSS